MGRRWKEGGGKAQTVKIKKKGKCYSANGTKTAFRACSEGWGMEGERRKHSGSPTQDGVCLEAQ